MEKIDAKLLQEAYQNYLTYELIESTKYALDKKAAYKKQLAAYLRFKKLINFEKTFILSDEGEKYSTNSEWYQFTDEGAHLIRLLASQHYHAIIKAKLALSETTEDDENISK